MLKKYNISPENGLVIYCGTASTEDSNGKERQLAMHFEPHRPIRQFIYRCHNRFDTENLKALLVDEGEDPYGFIVIDGNGTLFGRVRGTAREVLQKLSVDLPRKHGRGGQSALRFDRLRVEKRNRYIRKIAEMSTHHFISGDRPNVRGLVLAGSGDLKDALANDKFFDKRLRSIVLSKVDVSHGGETGFDQAIALSAETIGSVVFLREQHQLERYMSEIRRDTGKYCFSVDDTMGALEMGAVDTLIVWEDIDVNRLELLNPANGEATISFLASDDEKVVATDAGEVLEVLKKESFLDWISNNYQSFGCSLEFISDRSGLGRQFIMGFGGIGAILRWPVDFSPVDGNDEVMSTNNLNDDETSEEASEAGRNDEYDFEDGEFGL